MVRMGRGAPWCSGGNWSDNKGRCHAESRPWGSLRPHGASVHVVSQVPCHSELCHYVSTGVQAPSVWAHLCHTHMHTASPYTYHLQVPWLLCMCACAHTW